MRYALLVCAIFAMACSSAEGSAEPTRTVRGDSGFSAAADPDAKLQADAISGSDSDSDSGSTSDAEPTADSESADDTGSPDTSEHATDTGPAGAPTADQLLALTTKCTVASSGKYATDEGEPATIDVCSLPGAYFWKADMDIDCDGKTTSACSKSTDPDYQADTAFHDSKDQPLDAAALPYVVIPSTSSKWNYQTAGIQDGAVVAVIYGGKVTYAVFGDTGPTGIIGEASYATAKSLGIDPNPATGGTDGPVTYIVFSGKGAVVSPLENHAAATKLGESLAAKLVAK